MCLNTHFYVLSCNVYFLNLPSQFQLSFVNNCYLLTFFPVCHWCEFSHFTVIFYYVSRSDQFATSVFSFVVVQKHQTRNGNGAYLYLRVWDFGLSFYIFILKGKLNLCFQFNWLFLEVLLKYYTIYSWKVQVQPTSEWFLNFSKWN